MVGVFSLTPFTILSLTLTFDSLMIKCLGVGLFDLLHCCFFWLPGSECLCPSPGWEVSGLPSFSPSFPCSLLSFLLSFYFFDTVSYSLSLFSFSI